MISSFERGITEPKFNHITFFCEFFNTTPNFLYGYTQNPSESQNQQNLNQINTFNSDILNNFLNKNKIDENIYIELLDILNSILKGYCSHDDHKNSNM